MSPLILLSFLFLSLRTTYSIEDVEMGMGDHNSNPPTQFSTWEESDSNTFTIAESQPEQTLTDRGINDTESVASFNSSDESTPYTRCQICFERMMKIKPSLWRAPENTEENSQTNLPGTYIESSDFSDSSEFELASESPWFKMNELSRKWLINNKIFCKYHHHSFDKKCLSDWIRLANGCPICKRVSSYRLLAKVKGKEEVKEMNNTLRRMFNERFGENDEDSDGDGMVTIDLSDISQIESSSSRRNQVATLRESLKFFGEDVTIEEFFIVFLICLFVLGVFGSIGLGIYRLAS